MPSNSVTFVRASFDRTDVMESLAGCLESQRNDVVKVRQFLIVTQKENFLSWTTVLNRVALDLLNDPVKQLSKPLHHVANV